MKQSVAYCDMRDADYAIKIARIFLRTFRNLVLDFNSWEKIQERRRNEDRIQYRRQSSYDSDNSDGGGGGGRSEGEGDARRSADKDPSQSTHKEFNDNNNFENFNENEHGNDDKHNVRHSSSNNSNDSDHQNDSSDGECRSSKRPRSQPPSPRSTAPASSKMEKVPIPPPDYFSRAPEQQPIQAMPFPAQNLSKLKIKVNLNNETCKHPFLITIDKNQSIKDLQDEIRRRLAPCSASPKKPAITNNSFVLYDDEHSIIYTEEEIIGQTDLANSRDGYASVSLQYF